MGIRTWFERKSLEKKARARLRDLFQEPALLAGTSLRASHSSRYVFLDCEAHGGELTVIRFGILRHPRPYAFSRQAHEVIEYYTYDLCEPGVKVDEGVNLTRLRGQDACD